MNPLHSTIGTASHQLANPLGVVAFPPLVLCECRLEMKQAVNHTPMAAVLLETGSHRGQAVLELQVLLPGPPKCWDRACL